MKVLINGFRGTFEWIGEDYVDVEIWIIEEITVDKIQQEVVDDETITNVK